MKTEDQNKTNIQTSHLKSKWGKESKIVQGRIVRSPTFRQNNVGKQFAAFEVEVSSVNSPKIQIKCAVFGKKSTQIKPLKIGDIVTLEGKTLSLIPNPNQESIEIFQVKNVWRELVEPILKKLEKVEESL